MNFILQFIKKFVDLLLYGNFWIAAAALCMGLQTQFILVGRFYFSTFIWFLFSSTLFLYAIHRIVGLKKVAAFQDQGRYLVISTFRSHIIFYALVSALAAAIFYLLLPLRLQISIILPGLISMAYVLPFLAGRRRLRDLHYVKIFMIMATWAWITVVIPAMELNLAQQIPVWLMTLERALFIFAITLPFDIRDLEVDQHSSVKTIPAYIGKAKSIGLALVCLFLVAICAWLNYCIDVYSAPVFVAMLLSILSTGALVWWSRHQKHDYYFTGLLDGTMLLQLGLVYAASFWL